MASADGFPKPVHGLAAEFVAWPAGRPIHRVPGLRYAPVEFNGTGKGNARFSPLFTPKGRVIPTLYGGETFHCALMETVFHDVPHLPGLKAYDRQNLERFRASILVPGRDLDLVNLAGKALRKLGVPRSLLLESMPILYPQTRPWAEALHAQFPQADGMRWVSRQDDEAHALVLFGDRVRKNDLAPAQPPGDLLHDPRLYLQVLELAQMIGVDLL